LLTFIEQVVIVMTVTTNKTLVMCVSHFVSIYYPLLSMQ